jgi:tRNA/rRNA methyltransferase
MSIRDLSSVAIVLCEPQHPGNIGAVARAMGNFGLKDLRLVNPCDHRAPDARKFAVGSAHLLDEARLYKDLPAAIADRQLTVATTRRQGRLRGTLLDSTELPSLLNELPPEAGIGLVFGREDRGLSSEEVSRCSHAAAVTTTCSSGSLNLGQAVLLFLYELARQPQIKETRQQAEMPLQAEMEGMFAQMDSILERIAFINPSRPEAVLHRLRQMISRARPDREEIALLRGLWTQLAWSINDWRGRKRG